LTAGRVTKRHLWAEVTTQIATHFFISESYRFRCGNLNGLKPGSPQSHSGEGHLFNRMEDRRKV